MFGFLHIGAFYAKMERVLIIFFALSKCKYGLGCCISLEYCGFSFQLCWWKFGIGIYRKGNYPFPLWRYQLLGGLFGWEIKNRLFGGKVEDINLLWDRIRFFRFSTVICVILKISNIDDCMTYFYFLSILMVKFHLQNLLW